MYVIAIVLFVLGLVFVLLGRRKKTPQFPVLHSSDAYERVLLPPGSGSPKKFDEMFKEAIRQIKQRRGWK